MLVGRVARGGAWPIFAMSGAHRPARATRRARRMIDDGAAGFAWGFVRLYVRYGDDAQRKTFPANLQIKVVKHADAYVTQRHNGIECPACISAIHLDSWSREHGSWWRGASSARHAALCGRGSAVPRWASWPL